jgi:hypothetical protein
MQVRCAACVRHRPKIADPRAAAQQLGRGSFGEVTKVRNRLDGRFYAIKKIRLRLSAVSWRGGGGGSEWRLW